MKAYPAYKYSGIEWIGEIPMHWQNWKIAHAFIRIGSGTTPKSDNPEYHENGIINWINTGDLNDKILFSCKKKITLKALEDYTTLKLFPKASLIIAMYGATIGKTAVTAIEATTNQACCVLSGSEVIDTKFSFYWFIANKRHIVSMSFGGGQPNISQDLIKSLKISAPLFKEQTTIANFLDHKTTQIDAAIEKHRQLIELLQEHRVAIINEAVTKGINPDAPMKDSGIEWIGEVPAHWEVKSMRYLFSFGRGLSITKKDLIEEGIPCLNYGEIHSKYGFRVDPEIHHLKCVPLEFIRSDEKSLLKCGDFVFADTSEDLEGAGNFSFLDSEKPVFAGYHTVVLRQKENHNYKFLGYLFDSIGFRNQIRTEVKGVKVYSITQGILKKTKLLLPTITEQATIVDYLESETTRIDKEIIFAEQEINLL